MIDTNKLPIHVAIIMDGNGRWATQKGMPREYGHKIGGDTLREIVRASGEIGIKYLSVYAFSTENWGRPKKEVDTLMSLMVTFCKNEANDLLKNNVKVKFIGDVSGMPENVNVSMRSIEEKLVNCDGLQLNICVNYSGKTDIINAVKKIMSSGIDADDIDSDVFSKFLYTEDMPEPDLLIRTGGDFRISNFFLWQSAYTELVFTETYWPDFKRPNLEECIVEYQSRDRRFGKI